MSPGPPQPLRADSVSLGYRRRPVIQGLSLTVLPGLITAVVGANASGKSTLLRGLARLVKPAAGAVYLDGHDIAALPTRVVATRVGILAQSSENPEGLKVADLVGRGRHPHQQWFRQWSPGDERAVADALEATATADLSDRLVDELSGGQRQRVWIAMALAQQTQIMLLDEPTTSLDIAHQIEILELLAHLRNTQHRTIVLVIHDLNHACRYADHLIAMADGRIIGQGPPAQIITPALVKTTFNIDCQIITDPVAGTPMIIPIGTHPRPGPNEEPENHPRQPAPPSRNNASPQAEIARLRHLLDLHGIDPDVPADNSPATIPDARR